MPLLEVATSDLAPRTVAPNVMTSRPPLTDGVPTTMQAVAGGFGQSFPINVINI